MRRSYLLAGLAAALGAAGVVAWRAAPGRAEPEKPVARPAARAPRNTLPLARAVLFNTGVGYLQREGTVEDDARVDLLFPVTDINDLIKSLVVEDAGGTVRVVSYDGQEPVERTLKSFALDLTYNPTFGQILNQARGEKVEVTLQGSGAATSMTGVVVGMESEPESAVREVHHLNLLAAEGMRRVPLAQVQRLRFLNPTIESEFRRALEVLAGAHNSQKRTLSLHLKGEGKRAVKVGYVVDNPIWKASYRLALGAKGKPTLQGWAVVENTSDEDWKDVRLSLISARPINFQMDLYQPLFMPRPTVEPGVYASLRPPEYQGTMAAGAQGAVNLGVGGGFGGGGFKAGGGFGGSATGVQLGGIGGGLALGGMPAAADNEGAHLGIVGFPGGFNRYQVGPGTPFGGGTFVPPTRLSYEELQKRRAQQLEQRKAAREQARGWGSSLAGVDPQDFATTADTIGEEFRYALGQTVSLPRQKSALLPVLKGAVEATPVSVYSPHVHPFFPMRGVKLKNTTGNHLMQGPVTIYDGGDYAGDGRLPDLQPDEERLLSYAVDLGVEVKKTSAEVQEEALSADIVKGQLRGRDRLRQTTTYLIRNRSKQDRTLLVEQPVRDDWKLATDQKPAERSRDQHRFEWKVPAGKSLQREVVEERSRPYRQWLATMSDADVRHVLASAVPGAPVKAALRKVLEHRDKQAATARELAELNKQLAKVTDDQARLRANIDKVPKGSAAYKRYLDKFDQQETVIEKLQGQAEEKEALRQKQAKGYADYLEGLTVR